MRIPIALLLALVAACAPTTAPTPSEAPGPTPAPSDRPVVLGSLATPRPTTPATRDCTVSWMRGYRTLDLLVHDAELVVRATPIGQATVALRPGLGATPTRETRRTRFQVTSVLRGSGPADQLAVLEDVCPNLTALFGEEYVLFLHRADAPTEPATGGNYWSLAGPQGQFRIRDGKVAGPFFAFGHVVHSYEGATLGELVAGIAAVPDVDLRAASGLIERSGRAIVRQMVGDTVLPPATAPEWGLLRTGDVVRASSAVGLDLTPYLGRALIVVRYDLASPDAREIGASVVIAGGLPVGAWAVAWRDDKLCGVFALTASPPACDR